MVSNIGSASEMLFEQWSPTQTHGVPVPDGSCVRSNDLSRVSALPALRVFAWGAPCSRERERLLDV